MQQKQVLILCTGNSCRSQMAEGFINHDLGDSWRSYSAGTNPSGYVHPLAIAAMAEVGIDLSQGESHSTDMYRGHKFDVVITVCNDAAENCPVWLGGGEVVHIGFEDPAQATGSDAEKMEVFRTIRDQIRNEVIPFLRSKQS